MKKTRQIRALTVRQPHAHRIVTGDKVIENRSRPTKHRGLLAIHAGLTRADLELDDEGTDSSGHHVDDLEFGKVIGTVELVDCLRKSDVKKRYPELARSPDLHGGWCWILRGAKRIRPIEAKGKLGLWLWTPPRKGSRAR